MCRGRGRRERERWVAHKIVKTLRSACLPACLPAPWNPLAEREAGRSNVHKRTLSAHLFSCSI
jgi:hypothetical protein